MKEIKTYNDIDKALKNCEYKKEGGKYYSNEEKREIDTTMPERHWYFVKYQGRVYYDVASLNPNENKELKEIMLKNIRHQILEYQRDADFEKELTKK